MLVYHGVHKTCRPPKGSLLRKWTDKHPVDGWIGEYDEQTLEHGLRLKAELHATAEQKSRLQAALESQTAESELLKTELTACTEQSTRLQAALELQVAGNERLQAQLYGILDSLSWRLTAPLRAGRGYLPILRFLSRRE
jgi:hypothetical protein